MTRRLSGWDVVELNFSGQRFLLLLTAPAAAAAEAAQKEGDAAPIGAEGAGLSEGELVEKEDPLLISGVCAGAEGAAPMEVGEAAQQAEEAAAPAAADMAPPAAAVKKAKARATARGKGTRKRKAPDPRPEEPDELEAEAGEAGIAKDTAAPVVNGEHAASEPQEADAAPEPAGEAAGAAEEAAPMEVEEAAQQLEEGAIETAKIQFAGAGAAVPAVYGQLGAEDADLAEDAAVPLP